MNNEKQYLKKKHVTTHAIMHVTANLKFQMINCTELVDLNYVCVFFCRMTQQWRHNLKISIDYNILVSG